ncbi:MAG: DNA polymerase III subunit epsilon [Pelagibacteraceae bacterium]|nr:DNA polymerase III subunit epsilon [Pelagibacteraceae bacterium]|tara:strand:- start:44210 stop:44890 length:681 start_codon:yes stop_codon:yes gene_type:complete
MREVVIDTETTGLNHKEGDRITEVGCVELINHIATKNTLQFYCKVDKQISESASKISGITNKFLKDKKTFEENHTNFLNFIKNDTLIIHNASFDLGFINNELKLIGKAPIKNNIVDTVELARKTLNTRIANLDYLCRYFNIDLTERGTHSALLDSKLLADVYLELRGGKQFSMNLSYSQNIQQDSPSLEKNTKNQTKKIQISKEDILDHKKMTKSIKDPLWKKFNY